uniref:Uncharacterized protein n=1 Tax=Glossina brevipalpis TaxID=37001 RepID=A0A1A9WTV9_9MUSC
MNAAAVIQWKIVKQQLQSRHSDSRFFICYVLGLLWAGMHFSILHLNCFGTFMGLFATDVICNNGNKKQKQKKNRYTSCKQDGTDRPDLFLQFPLRDIAAIQHSFANLEFIALRYIFNRFTVQEFNRFHFKTNAYVIILLKFLPKAHIIITYSPNNVVYSTNNK